MRIKHLFFMLSLLFPVALSAQTIDGFITDEYGKPVFDALLISKAGDTLDRTDELGYFDFEWERKMSFGVFAKGYPVEWIALKRPQVETMQIALGLKTQDFAEVMITRRGMENALDIESVNILDYLPYNSHILTLKKHKKSYYLGVDSIGRQGIDYKLSFERPRRLFMDCMNNTYILSEDSAYQVHVAKDAIFYISTLPLGTFDKYIASCVSDFDNGLVLQEFTGYNQGYELTLYDDEDAKPFFKKLDTVGYNIAYENMHRLQIKELMDSGDTLALKEYEFRQRQARSRASRAQPRHDPIQYYSPIQFYDPGLNHNANVGLRYRRVQQWQANNYFNERHRRMASRTGPVESRASLEAANMLSSKPLHMRTFQLGNFMLVVDYDEDSVRIYNNHGEHQKTVSFNIGDEVEDVWKDRSTGFLYLYCKDKGTHKIYSLNPFTGKTEYVKSFQKAPRTESVQVYGGWVYFRVLDRGFFSIKRVKLPEAKYHTS